MCKKCAEQKIDEMQKAKAHKNESTNNAMSAMQAYKEIHIWEFPPLNTFITLDDAFRKCLFDDLMHKMNFHRAAELLNASAPIYGITRNYNAGHLCSWKKGQKKDRGVIKNVNIPLWIAIEMSKSLSNSEKIDNPLMHDIEKNIVSYECSGKAIAVNNPILPVLLTPELVSVIFHLCGDGHIGEGRTVSSYRQMTPEALNNFLKKLNNCFGAFKLNESEFKDGKLVIPRVITEFYKHYFELNSCNWDVARIPESIKQMNKDFLTAGLLAFMVDEGHISHSVEIYSKNKLLLQDVLSIAASLGLETSHIDEKFKEGKLSSYRVRLSLENMDKLCRGMKKLSKEFPTCTLCHKSKHLENIANRQARNWKQRDDGETKELILTHLDAPITSKVLAERVGIGISTLNEHMLQLQKSGSVRNVSRIGNANLWRKVE
ncbi:MAG: winged helix-turn-helix domain-containing protein [Nanoarchaeota archaeon]